MNSRPGTENTLKRVQTVTRFNGFRSIRRDVLSLSKGAIHCSLAGARRGFARVARPERQYPIREQPDQAPSWPNRDETTWPTCYACGGWKTREKRTGRASLENAHTGERKGFAGLDELFAFLRQQTDDEASTVEW